MSRPQLAQEVTAMVVEQLPRLLFRVVLEDRRQLMYHVAGKMRKNFVRLLPGDQVRVELSPLDSARGRIVCKQM